MRYLITFSYDGSKYKGYQKQPEVTTIQGELERVLTGINNREVLVSASGRTDAGVSALCQVAHFDTEKEIDEKYLQHKLNESLPMDITINAVEKVGQEFDSRFSVKKKTYIYKF